MEAIPTRVVWDIGVRWKKHSLRSSKAHQGCFVGQEDHKLQKKKNLDYVSAFFVVVYNLFCIRVIEDMRKMDMVLLEWDLRGLGVCYFTIVIMIVNQEVVSDWLLVTNVMCNFT